MSEFEKINKYIFKKFNNLIKKKVNIFNKFEKVDYMIYNTKDIDNINIFNIIDKYINKTLDNRDENIYQKILNEFKIEIKYNYAKKYNLYKIMKIEYYRENIVPYIEIIFDIYKNIKKKNIIKKKNNECYLFINELLQLIRELELDISAAVKENNFIKKSYFGRLKTI
jgi:uncharacterized protein YjhX (UPF0386 family)